MNGAVRPFAETFLQLNELGLLRGFGVFDYLRTYQGVALHLEAHLRRLANSVRFLHLDWEWSHSQLADILDELLYLRANREADVAFRLLITGGYSDNGTDFQSPNFFITTETLAEIPAYYYTEGTKVILYEYQRQFPRIKTTNYLSSYLVRPALQAQKAQDVLYHQNGQISECSRSNFFIFKGDTLITPSEGVLEGITRQTVLRLAEARFKVEVRPLGIEELAEADEAFKTGTRAEIMPIVQVGAQRIGKGRVGAKTQALRHDFFEYHNHHLLA
ncbi:MAG: aminotransferase IV [Microscillaceae bacterium]|nr:aminotransferase IV [Microscillaceae bacterium]